MPEQPMQVAHIALDAKGAPTEQGFTELGPGMAVIAEINDRQATENRTPDRALKAFA